ncbi:hypothetical protein [Flagellimonas hadalis]|uniref:Uncharacterized protein n=1 Tax=Flagellimonas hadalis TaxID=2597517 RepID=A0A5N5ITY5_9FLAO|nr:hypothetical protein [Allomuricauda hadalis]KAB5490891.1 hypothetical protein FOT42_005525 [Allomuricauda hadalis]
MNTFSQVKKRDELEYNKWVDHLNNTKERTNYSIRRMDLLIISISGAGIYIIFETIRELKAYKINVEHENLLLISGICFLVAITSNFISQVTGYHANNNEECYTQLELRKIEKRDFDECEKNRYNGKVNKYNKWTDALNLSSIILMFLGLGLLTAFNYYLF